MRQAGEFARRRHPQAKRNQQRRGGEPDDHHQGDRDGAEGRHSDQRLVLSAYAPFKHAPGDGGQHNQQSRVGVGEGAEIVQESEQAGDFVADRRIDQSIARLSYLASAAYGLVSLNRDYYCRSRD